MGVVVHRETVATSTRIALGAARRIASGDGCFDSEGGACEFAGNALVGGLKGPALTCDSCVREMPTVVLSTPHQHLLPDGDHRNDRQPGTHWRYELVDPVLLPRPLVFEHRPSLADCSEVVGRPPVFVGAS